MISSKYSLLLFFFTVVSWSGLVEPFLLKGFIKEGSLILEKADQQFMELIDEVLNKTHVNVASEGLKSLTDTAESSLASVQNAGGNVASIIFAPFSGGNSSLLLSPVLISEGVLRDLTMTGRAVLKLALPLNGDEPERLPNTTIADVLDTISNFSIPVSTTATRDALKHTFNDIPEGVFALRSSVTKALRNLTSKV